MRKVAVPPQVVAEKQEAEQDEMELSRRQRAYPAGRHRYILKCGNEEHNIPV